MIAHVGVPVKDYETAKALENLRSDIDKHKKHLEGNKFALGQGAMNPNNQ